MAKRQKLHKSHSKKLFRNTAMSVHGKNVLSTVMRGGIRL